MVYTLFSTRASRWLHRAEQWLLPPLCIACGGPGNLQLAPQHMHLDLCTTCFAQLPFNHQACRRCGLPLQGSAETLVCGQCLRRPPRYQHSYCGFVYGYPIAPLIRHLKYGKALAAARVLGELLANQLIQQHQATAEPWPDCIIPVPLHARRYRERGYNQVIELARHLERRLQIPLRTDLVSRIRHTPEQAGLSRRERRRNLRRAFDVPAPDLPNHVAVLDDVITTGTTVNELAHTLLKAGVQHIAVWGLARAPAPP